MISKTLFRYIAFYSTAETADSAYVIGGQNTLDVVAQYNNDQWTRLPDLRKGRYGHGSIMVGDRLLVIGGWNLDVVE